MERIEGIPEQNSKLIILLLLILTAVLYRERCGVPSYQDDSQTKHVKPPLNRGKATKIPAKPPLTDGVEGMNVTILIAGRSGTGKHTLVKSLFGGRDLESRIKTEGPLTGSSLTLEGIATTIMFWSSPGLYDGFFSDRESVGKMAGLVDTLDLFIYTMRMDDTRLRPEDVVTLQHLSGAFGSSLWERCVFVLTFANRVDYLDSHQLPRRSKEHFRSRAKQWEGHIRDTLEKKGIPEEVVQELPIIPAGHHSEPRLFTDEEPWVRQLVRAIVERVDEGVKTAIPILTSIYDHG